jgi:DNA-binding response OmpR family regulator
MFAVTVPLGTSPPEVTQDNGLIPVSDTAASAVSILYVEDNVVVLDAVRYLLTVEGFRVTSATSGEHVTNLLGKRDFRADIVVSDYLLPAGVNGPDIINMVREKLGASIPAIIMTADGSGQTTQLARRLGCEILRKPVNGEQLVYAIHRLLGESSSA